MEHKTGRFEGLVRVAAVVRSNARLLGGHDSPGYCLAIVITGNGDCVGVPLRFGQEKSWGVLGLAGGSASGSRRRRRLRIHRVRSPLFHPWQ